MIFYLQSPSRRSLQLMRCDGDDSCHVFFCWKKVVGWLSTFSYATTCSAAGHFFELRQFFYHLNFFWNFGHFWPFITILDNLNQYFWKFCFFLTILTIATSEVLWAYRYFGQLRTLVHDNHIDLTIKSKTRQHSQVLQCLIVLRLPAAAQARPSCWRLTSTIAWPRRPSFIFPICDHTPSLNGDLVRQKSRLPASGYVLWWCRIFYFDSILLGWSLRKCLFLPIST